MRPTTPLDFCVEAHPSTPGEHTTVMMEEKFTLREVSVGKVAEFMGHNIFAIAKNN